MPWRRPPSGRRRLRDRFVRLVKALFGTGPGDDPEELEGGVGVREPRRPLNPTLSGAVALEPPPVDVRDVRAVGEGPD